jgi:small subunit ribosomal protein S16
MAVKIRLARHGKKAHTFFHIVVADSRSPRDGKLIEKLGTYDPNTNPATINLNFNSALSWLEKGAQPTDTVRAILSYEGVLLKKHLDGGVKKGAFSAEVAQQRLDAWLSEQSRRVEAKKDAIARGKKSASQERIVAETKTKEAKAEIVAKKRKVALDAAAKAKVQSAEAQETPATPEVATTKA